MRSEYRRSCHGRSRRVGFTLVELLVVIGIIAVLISILLPSLAKARVAALKLQCASNMRTIGQYLMAYTVDNRGNLPVDGQGDWEPASWTKLICPPTSTAWDAEVSSPAIFKCPLSREEVKRSYAFAGEPAWWVGPSTNDPAGPNPANLAYGRRVATGGNWNGCWQLIKPAKMRSAETVLMLEMGPWHPPDGPEPGWPSNGLPGNDWRVWGGPFGVMSMYYWGQYSGPWCHEFKSSNYLFVDGHVEEIVYPTPYTATWVHVPFYEGGELTRQLFYVDKTKTVWDPGFMD